MFNGLFNCGIVNCKLPTENWQLSTENFFIKREVKFQKLDFPALNINTLDFGTF